MRIDKPKKRRNRFKALPIKKIIRQAVIDRDENKCRVSGQQAQEIHHIVYRSRGGNNTVYNLISLSHDIHEQVHKNGKKWFPILLKIQQKHYPNLTKEMMKK